MRRDRPNVPATVFVLAAFFVVAGTMHFIVPAAYMKIMPATLPFRRELVLVSGALEIAGGLSLLSSRTRYIGALGLVALLIAVWPANFQMLMNAREEGTSGLAQLLLWIRLPLQIPLIYLTWRIRHSAGVGVA